MRKLVILFCCVFLLYSCNEKRSVEVIPNYDEIYTPISKIDITPKLVSGNEKELSEKINNEIQRLSIKGKIKLDYKLYIDENGNVDKVKVIQSPDKNFTNIAIKEFENWKFKPGIKDSKNVKSQYRWYFNIDKRDSNLVNLNEEKFFVYVENMPEPIGGLEAIQNKIHYPEIAKRAGIEGKVYVKAFIDEKGNVVATEIMKGIGTGLDQAAERAIKETKFKPGIQRGKPVKTQVAVPIIFTLDSSKTKKSIEDKFFYK